MTPGYLLHIKDTLSEADQQKMTTRPFLSLLHALLWLSRCTRYDIAAPLTIVSRASAKPDTTHWNVLIKILKYLGNTADQGLVFRPTTSTPSLSVFSDASHANDAITARSMSGSFVTVNGNILDWFSKHQPYTTLHSGEAETIAAAIAATHIEYWRQLLTQVLHLTPQAILFTDSTTARNILTNPVHNTVMKHIRIKLLFVRELVAAHRFTIQYISGKSNPADMLTKPLSHLHISALQKVLCSWGGDHADKQPQDIHKSPERNQRNRKRLRKST
jgi:hypothetical protein